MSIIDITYRYHLALMQSINFRRGLRLSTHDSFLLDFIHTIFVTDEINLTFLSDYIYICLRFLSSKLVLPNYY